MVTEARLLGQVRGRAGVESGAGAESLFEAAQHLKEGRGSADSRGRLNELAGESLESGEAVANGEVHRFVDLAVGGFELEVGPLYLLVVGTVVEEQFGR